MLIIAYYGSIGRRLSEFGTLGKKRFNLAVNLHTLIMFSTSAYTAGSLL